MSYATRSLKKRGRELCRAVRFGIEEDQDGTPWSGSPASEVDGSLELAATHQPQSREPHRARQVEEDRWIDSGCDPPDEDRYRLDLAMALDDGADGDGGQAAWPVNNFSCLGCLRALWSGTSWASRSNSPAV